MLVTTLILGGVIIGATTIAGLITLYRLRQMGAAKESAISFFAADAGLERALYFCFKNPPTLPPPGVPPPGYPFSLGCADFTSSVDPISDTSHGQTTYTVQYSDGPPHAIRSVGHNARSSRALRFVF